MWASAHDWSIFKNPPGPRPSKRQNCLREVVVETSSIPRNLQGFTPGYFWRRMLGCRESGKTLKYSNDVDSDVSAQVVERIPHPIPAAAAWAPTPPPPPSSSDRNSKTVQMSFISTKKDGLSAHCRTMMNTYLTESSPISFLVSTNFIEVLLIDRGDSFIPEGLSIKSPMQIWFKVCFLALR